MGLIRLLIHHTRQQKEAKIRKDFFKLRFKEKISALALAGKLNENEVRGELSNIAAPAVGFAGLARNEAEHGNLREAQKDLETAREPMGELQLAEQVLRQEFKFASPKVENLMYVSKTALQEAEHAIQVVNKSA